jgi:hypothetical protein
LNEFLKYGTLPQALVTFFVLIQWIIVHFFCLPKRNEPKKKAASNLFWEYHFGGCTRNTTRSLHSLKQYCLLMAIASQPPKFHSISKKYLNGIDRLAAIWFAFKFLNLAVNMKNYLNI